MLRKLALLVTEPPRIRLKDFEPFTCAYRKATANWEKINSSYHSVTHRNSPFVVSTEFDFHFPRKRFPAKTTPRVQKFPKLKGKLWYCEREIEQQI